MKDCPAAISLGQQVSEQGKAWIWFPNQWPFFIQSHRLSDVTFHCLESAKLYVDRVEQNDPNVPVLSETVECLAVPAATGSSASSSSEKPSSAPLGEKSPSASHEDVAPSVHPKSVPGDEPLVLEPDESKELVGTSRVRDVSPSPSLGGEGGPPENPPEKKP